MIVGEKIALLRKKNNWSQEELANELGISRQSVSKWESGNSIPDLDKIVKMSHLFGVSTDYLLKDELEEEIPSEIEEVSDERRSISLEEANQFLDVTRDFARKVCISISIFILSPVLLLLLGGMAEEEIASLTDNMAGGMGITVLLLLVAVGAVNIVMAGISYEKYDYLEKERITLQYGVAGIVHKRKEEFSKTFQKNIGFGIGIIIVGVCPLMIMSAFKVSDFVLVVCVGVLLVFVAAGANRIVWAGIIQGSFQKLLEEEDYSEENKAIKDRSDTFAGIYWCLVTAIYLAVSLPTNSWEISWMIWPIAGLVFAALHGIVRGILKRNEKKLY